MQAFRKNEVVLTNGLFKEREQVNREYLISLNNNALLQNFYMEAGINLPGLPVISDPADTYLHWGWEAQTCQLRGHFLGHWMSAAAHLVAANNDRELEAKLYTIIDELKRCQKENGGKWIGSIPEKYMDYLRTGKNIWSPQYTMHKTLMGLLDAYECTGYEVALDIVKNAADWYTDWINALGNDKHAATRGEAGGMLEIWARMYGLTKGEKYLTLAKAYHYPELDCYLNGTDVLTDNHANASIPMSHGTAKMYEVTGDAKWLDMTKGFWNLAVKMREAYATGGQNAGEFWIAPHKFYSAASDRTQEFCTMYNMVRLADYLYRFTGAKEYTDYIEHALYNAFLTQQNRYTGMPTYFLPMTAGSHKTWGSKTRDFWCCYGTMVQAQTLYPSLIYYTDDETKTVSVEQYIGSKAQMDTSFGNVSISQEINMNYCQGVLFGEAVGANLKTRWSFSFTVTSEETITLRFRIPGWSEKAYCDKEQITASKDGYYEITDKFDDRKIQLLFVPKITERGLSDNPNITALLDGPIVLAAIGEAGKTFSLGGRKPAEALSVFLEHTYDTFPWKQNSYRSYADNGLVTFIPLYEVTDETYTIYIRK